MEKVPEICLAYASVFQALKFENGIMIIIGLIIGLLAARLEK